MKWVAICLMGIGGVSLFANLMRGSNLMSLLFAVVYALTGYWTYGASQSFRINAAQRSPISEALHTN